MNNLTILLKQQGKFEDARPLLQEALNLNRKVNGDAHRDTITSMNQLGVLLLDDAKPADAEPLLRGALAATLKSQGSTHPDTLNARNNIVSLLLRQGKLSEAEKILDQLVQDTPANSPRLPGRKDLLAQIRAKLK